MGREGEDGSEMFSPKTKKIIHNLKEIVNSSESEIYAALKDSNMDPNEAVQRLLSQDTFQEVKSKRERRKEMKEAQESRFTYCGADYGVRSVNERNVGQGGSIQTSFHEFGNVAYKDDGELSAPSPSYLATQVPGNTMNEQFSSHSDFLNTTGARSRIQSKGATDNLYKDMQPSTKFQPVWSGTAAGNLSMADVVKLGRLPCKDVVAKPSHVSLSHSQPETLYDSHCQNPSTHDEWPVVDDQPASHIRSSFLDESLNLDVKEGFSVSKDCPSDGIQLMEGGDIDKNHGSDQTASASTSSGQIILTDAVKSLDIENSSCYDHTMSMHGHTMSMHEQVEGADFGSNQLVPNHSMPLPDDPIVAVSYSASSVKKLSLEKGEKEDSCALVLPNHLQALAADCSHLIFGTYRSGTSHVLPGQIDSNQLKDDCEGVSRAMYGLSNGHPDTCLYRNAEHNNDEALESIYNDRGGSPTSREYEFISFQPEVMKQDAIETNPRHEYLESYANYSSFRNTELESSGFSPTRAGLGMPYEMALKSSGFSSSEPSSILPQSFTTRQYPPKLPKEELINMVGYPSHLRSYSHLQSTQQQVYRNGGEFQQSLAGIDYGLPQYRGGSLINRSAPSPNPVYGHGTSLDISQSNLHSRSASLMANRNGHNDIFHPLYNSGDPFTNGQNTISSSSNHGPGLRMKSPFPDDSGYISLGHNQYHAGYERGRMLPAQHYGGLGYPNAYPTQGGLAQDYQEQRLYDMTLDDTQNLLQEQLQQLWRGSH